MDLVSSNSHGNLDTRRASQDWQRLGDALQRPWAAPRMTFASLEVESTLTAWRATRWLLMAAGRAHINSPLWDSVDREDWTKPIRVDKPHISARSLPGIFKLNSKSVRLQPPPHPNRTPDPTDADPELTRRLARADWSNFESALYTAFHGYRLDEPHPDSPRLGDGWRPLVTAGVMDGGTLEQSDQTRQAIYLNYPKPDDLLEIENFMLVELSAYLTDHSEDNARKHLMDTLCLTFHEAHSLVQTAKRWSASLSIIDPEVERVEAVRRLQDLAQRAVEMHELPTALAANRELSKTLGLYRDSVSNALDEALESFGRMVSQKSTMDSGVVVDTTASVAVEQFGGTLPAEHTPANQFNCDIDSNPGLLQPPTDHPFIDEDNV